MIRYFRAAQPWLTVAARLFLAYVWFDAGWPKFTDSAGTVRSVRAFQILPEALVPAFGYTLPIVELALGVLLLLGLFTRLSAVATGLLMLVFIGGIVSAWTRGLSIDCGCFGNTGSYVPDPVPGYIRDLLRDTGFLACAAFIALWPRTPLAVDRFLRPNTSSSDDDLEVDDEDDDEVDDQTNDRPSDTPQVGGGLPARTES
jgi:uncharacterized membrane protein YphA (DoxX/SURF4 family)